MGVYHTVQSDRETGFAKGMYVYHYRLFDRYNRSIASLAVLGDDHTGWRPNQYRDELWSCELSFKFPIVKLLDYGKQAIVDFLEHRFSNQDICDQCRGTASTNFVCPTKSLKTPCP
ncbi:MAG: hypothetical protein AB4426_03470 [Xenococcaceae cyanobacterium]